MKITWLGQAGLLFETGGKALLVDPYLSDSVGAVNPRNHRRVPVDESFFRLKPDCILITHNHLDHLDKETLRYYLTEDYAGLVLAPEGSWQEIRAAFPSSAANCVLFNNKTTWTEGDVRFRAVKAEHSDPNAIGVFLTAEGKTYYVTGDTLYSENVFASLPADEVFALFLPVNGVGNNLNFTDAAAFAERIHPRYTVPVHFGLFDGISPENFPVQKKVIPTIYREIRFD